MTRPGRRSTALLLVAMTLLACGPATSSPTAGATVAPSVGASIEPSPAGSPADGCPVPTSTGRLPSNTLTGIVVDEGPNADTLTFQFGDQAAVPPEPMGRLRPVSPPFTRAESGDPLTVVGDRFVEVVFTGMLIADDEGNPTFQTQRDARWGKPAIKHSVMFDESEGQVGFVVGYTGNGCVALGGDPEARTVTLSIIHPPG